MLLLWPWDFPGPGTQARSKFIRPLVRRLKDYPTAFPAHHNLMLGSEPTLLWQTYGLTTPILKELRSNTLHGASIYLSLYDVKP